MLIWGTYVTKKTVQCGNFHCPNCERQRGYRMRRPRKWGHLYWIPIIPMQEFEPYIECDSCTKEFLVSVLQFDPIKQEMDFLVLLTGAMCQAAYYVAAAQQKAPSVQAIVRTISQVSGIEPSQDAISRILATRDVQCGTHLIEVLATHLTSDGREELFRMLAPSSACDTATNSAYCKVGRALGLSSAHMNGILIENGFRTAA